MRLSSEAAPSTARIARDAARRAFHWNNYLTVAPSDKVSASSATYSQSTHILQVNASSSDPLSVLQVLLGSNNQLLGTMVTQGSGTYTFQILIQAGAPASVSIVSNLGAKAGQGVKVTP